MPPPKVLLVMADYGHEPTETSVPYAVFREAGFEVHFATEKGVVPKCDEVLMTGWTRRLLGATMKTLSMYRTMQTDLAENSSKILHAWSDPDFTLTDYDFLFFPGGHQKGVRQVIESEKLHRLIGDYFVLTRRAEVDGDEGRGKKGIGAVCHGVEVLAYAQAWFSDKDPEYNAVLANSTTPVPETPYTKKSILTPLATTTLPGPWEQGIYHLTSPWLGDYYKTFGPDSPTVELIVRANVANLKKQFRCNLNMMSKFVVEDSQWRYWSGRWPGDTEALARACVVGMGGKYIPK